MLSFLKSLLSEPDGSSISYARVSGSIALLATIGWVTYLVLKTHALPPLGEASAFVSASYAVNKVATAAQSYLQK